MPIRIKRLGHIVGDRVVPAGDRPGNFAATLTNLLPCGDGTGPEWSLDLVVGEGPSARNVQVILARFISQNDYEGSLSEPKLLRLPKDHTYGGRSLIFVLFRNQFFESDREPNGLEENEELLLRVKRSVYKDEEELKSLRSYVSNIEAALEYQRTGPQREPIPDDVKLAVWARDGGACARCGTRENLHFDHVIPVAKGGQQQREQHSNSL